MGDQATNVILKQTLENNYITNNNNDSLEPNIESLRWFVYPYECYNFFKQSIPEAQSGNFDNFLKFMDENMHLLYPKDNIIGPIQPISIISSNSSTTTANKEHEENNNNDKTTSTGKDDNITHTDHAEKLCRNKSNWGKSVGPNISSHNNNTHTKIDNDTTTNTIEENTILKHQKDYETYQIITVSMHTLHERDLSPNADFYRYCEEIRSCAQDIVTTISEFPIGTNVAIFSSSANGFVSNHSDLDL